MERILSRAESMLSRAESMLSRAESMLSRKASESIELTWTIEEIRAEEKIMFWCDRLFATILFTIVILSFLIDPTECVYYAGIAALFFTLIQLSHASLVYQRCRLGQHYSSEPDAKFNRCAFYGERVVFLAMIIWLYFEWPYASIVLPILIILVNMRYIMPVYEKYARMTTTQESEKTEADDAASEENKQSESENEVEEEQKTVQADKDYDKNEEEDISTRLSDANVRIRELQDLYHEQKKEKEFLTTFLDRLSNSIYSMCKDLTRLREENKDLDAKLSEANSWYQFQVQATLDYKKRNNNLQKENKKLQESVKEMKSFSEIKSLYEFYKSCYGDKELEYMNLMEEKIELAAKLSEKTKYFDQSLQTLKEERNFLEQYKHELEEECNRLEQENSELTSEIFDAKSNSATVNLLEEKCRRLERENAELRREVCAKSGAAVVSELEEKCRRLEQVNAELTREVSATSDAAIVSDLEEKCRWLEAENADLTREVAAARDSAAACQCHLGDLDGDDIVLVD